MSFPQATKMKQRRFGLPPVPFIEQGDCWATAVCSYAGFDEADRNELHRRIVLSDSALRRAGKDHENGSWWWNTTQRFLKEKDCLMLTLVNPDEVESNLLYIASGKTVRGTMHSVIAYGNGELWSDPHPSDDGVVKITEWICWWDEESV
jgi:hypothetical protein